MRQSLRWLPRSATQRQATHPSARQGGQRLMFTRNRLLAAATVVGALAVAGPVASASAAPVPSVQANVGAASGFDGYGNPANRGYGNSWNNNGYGAGNRNPWGSGYG